MGIKGDKMSSDSALTAELLLEKLSTIPDITSKKMFGGHGIFCEGKMFGIVDSKGQAFLKIGESNKESFEKEDAKPHGKMPYMSIPEKLFADVDELTQWAKSSIEI